MSYTKGSESAGAITTEDSAGATPTRGELVAGARHYRGAREAPRDFGLMSGNVTGAHVLLMTALDIRDRLMRNQPTKRELGTYVPTDREAMAELVNVTHQEIMKVLTEVSDFISGPK